VGFWDVLLPPRILKTCELVYRTTSVLQGHATMSIVRAISRKKEIVGRAKGAKLFKILATGRVGFAASRAKKNQKRAGKWREKTSRDGLGHRDLPSGWQGANVAKGIETFATVKPRFPQSGGGGSRTVWYMGDGGHGGKFLMPIKKRDQKSGINRPSAVCGNSLAS